MRGVGAGIPIRGDADGEKEREKGCGGAVGGRSCDWGYAEAGLGSFLIGNQTRREPCMSNHIE